MWCISKKKVENLSAIQNGGSVNDCIMMDSSTPEISQAQ